MKQLRLSLAAAAITLALSAYVFAGQMPGGITEPKPAPTPQILMEGDMPGGVAVTSEPTSDTTSVSSMTEIGLHLLQSLLSLL